MNRRQRLRGCLIGLAVGDAVGTTLEFSHPGTFTPITDMVGGGPFWLRAGEWTDDTSMALCLAESLIETGRFDPVDQLERYVRWYRHGPHSCKNACFDIGNTTRMALHVFEQTRNPWSGATDPLFAGNGLLMRLAPVPMAYNHDAAKAIALSGDSSRTTHGAATAVDACRYFGGLLFSAIDGRPKSDLLSPRHAPIPDFWRTTALHPEVDEVAAGSFLSREPPEINGSGYVVRTLEAALWAFRSTGNFRDGCLAAANLGRDADTVAAVFGQIAGAHYGESGIPTTWREKLARRELIQEYADRLAMLSAMV